VSPPQRLPGVGTLVSVSMRAVLLLTASVVFAAGCGGSEKDDVRAAVERVTAALRAGDSATWCASIVPDTLLPDPVLRQIPVEGGQSGSLRELEGFQRACGERRFLDNVSERERTRAPTEVPDEVRILDLTPTEGVDGAALVGSGKDPATLVRINDEWLLVFDSR
jgi:hypothetical protein